MEENEEHILDQFDEEPERQWYQHWLITFGPFVLFLVGAVFRLQHWPYATLLMAIALVLILLRSILFFFIKKREVDEWFYFIGRVALISVLAVDFAITPVSRTLLLSALSLFALGVVVYIWKQRGQKNEVVEDDY